MLTAFVVCSILAVRCPSFGSIIKMTCDHASYPDVSLSTKMCAQRKAGRRQRERRSLCPPSVPFPWSLAVRHQPLASTLLKNEAPEEETDLGLCCNQMWDACWQRFEPRTQNTVMCVKLSTQASVDLVLVELKKLRRQRQKTIGFMSKTTALHVHQALKYISLTSTARLRRETSQRNVL